MVLLLGASCGSDDDAAVARQGGSATTEPLFATVEPFSASTPEEAVSGFWVALGVRNHPQVLMSASDACLEDLGGQDGLDELADRLEELGVSSTQQIQLDRSSAAADSSGEARASFELERVDWDAWLDADPSESMEDHRLPPIEVSDQRYALVGDTWVLDDECGELGDVLVEP